MTDSRAPIVLGNSPSSGSTMLGVVLARHPSIVSGGELHVLDRPSLFDVTAETLHALMPTWLRSGYPRTFVTGTQTVFTHAADFGWSEAELLRAAAATESWHALLQVFFGRVEDRNPGTRCLEATPGNVFGFHRALETFPQARLIHLVRDGSDACASLVRRGHSPFRAVARWMFAVLAGLRLECLDATLRVNYEELVRDPHAVLGTLLSRLGEDYDPAITRPSETADARLASWHASEHGEITDAAVGSHREMDMDPVYAVMGASRVTDEGRALLASLPGVPTFAGDSALDLLEHLGYEGPAQARRLTSSEVRAVDEELAAFRERQWRQHLNRSPVCPVTVIGSAQAASRARAMRRSTGLADGEPPILIRGSSGAAVVAATLDAGPEVAVMQGLDPELLQIEDASQARLLALAHELDSATNLRAAAQSLDSPELQRFFARCARGGLSAPDIAQLLREHAREKGWESTSDRLAFVERCCVLKMSRAGKARWALRCGQAWATYLDRWPQAWFLHVVRDDRELSAGAERFKWLVVDPDIRALEISFDSLLADPEPELAAVSEFLELVRSPDALVLGTGE